MRSLLAFITDALLGPRCPACNYRARGPRTLAEHRDRKCLG